MNPPGWKLTKINGTRRAVNPKGENVAYNQYLNAQAQASGFKNHNEYRKYAKKISAYRDKENAKDLALGSAGLKEFKKLIIDRKTLSAKDKAPGGTLARYLESIGRRPKNAPYPVGDTPQGE